MDNEKKIIENFREAMGTLPSQKPEVSYEYKNALETAYVKLTDYPNNPYKSMLRMACATWGDGKDGEGHGSTQKWERLSPVNRYRVALSVLTGNTLPTAMESVNLTFEFSGVPRHTFDQFVRARIGCGHASIGSRDNNKLDCAFVLYPSLYNAIQKDVNLKDKFDIWVRITKDLYSDILKTGEGSWQTARAVLPMSYSHSWVTYFNLLALKGQMNRRLMACEEAPMVLIFWKMREEIAKKFPLIANYLRPVCDNAKRCVYHEGPEGLTKFFSALFAGCNRWPTKETYSEFNNSCTNYDEISKYVKVVGPNDWIKYTFDMYDSLEDSDKKLFCEE